MTQGQHSAHPLLFCGVLWSGTSVLNALDSHTAELLLCSLAASWPSVFLIVASTLSSPRTLSFLNTLFLIHCGLGSQITWLVRTECTVRVNAPKWASVSPKWVSLESILWVRCSSALMARIIFLLLLSTRVDPAGWWGAWQHPTVSQEESFIPPLCCFPCPKLF